MTTASSCRIGSEIHPGGSNQAWGSGGCSRDGEMGNGVDGQALSQTPAEITPKGPAFQWLSSADADEIVILLYGKLGSEGQSARLSSLPQRGRTTHSLHPSLCGPRDR
ncbi:hypothetical protein ASPSYDRAFT_286629 [Aspergillus sydowii CBS 593.65]|uniref:Uncharacterized protein n=1 Tax=Aspergillus sydowii CBS 593.65 TaxID=1036612 RepID=A0A1L9TXE1_9EURO|nr:uncharacterized protein ASPSYDRAFT_286629 [Aspergillus sydowii CBS 593.65]OJJ64052.1 hypothetical protein ASPSYDRAFT_286629 [Aspergillus sydowii CBS 593.65]